MKLVQREFIDFNQYVTLGRPDDKHVLTLSDDFHDLVNEWEKCFRDVTALDNIFFSYFDCFQNDHAKPYLHALGYLFMSNKACFQEISTFLYSIHVSWSESLECLTLKLNYKKPLDINIVLDARRILSLASLSLSSDQQTDSVFIRLSAQGLNEIIHAKTKQDIKKYEQEI